MNHCLKTLAQALWVDGAQGVVDLRAFGDARVLISVTYGPGFSGNANLGFELSRDHNPASGDVNDGTWEPVMCGNCSGNSTSMTFPISDTDEAFINQSGSTIRAVGRECVCCVGEGQRFLRMTGGVAGLTVHAINSAREAFPNV